MAARAPLLDLPTELSFGLGRSKVPPVGSADAIGSGRWTAKTKRYMAKLRDEASAAGDWSKFVFLHVHEHRWRALAAAVRRIPPDQLPGLFREVWADSEVIWQERRNITNIARSIPADQRDKLFTEEDRKTFDNLPERFTVYRGAKSWNANGMSWTLEVHRAVHFATFHHEDGGYGSLSPDLIGVVMEKSIRKSDVLFYTDDRSENEIVLKRFEKGRLSPEGMLWVSQARGADAFREEIQRRRRVLSPELIRGAEKLLALIEDATLEQPRDSIQ